MIHLTFGGHVEKGEGIATKLGCPTANIEIRQGGIIPGLGVYVGQAEVEGKKFPALICINDGRHGLVLKLEVHLLDQQVRDLLGKYICVNIFEKVRELVNWQGDDHMKEMISGDLTFARNWFNTHPDCIA